MNQAKLVSSNEGTDVATVLLNGSNVTDYYWWSTPPQRGGECRAVFLANIFIKAPRRESRISE
ncbi:hypothetical protein X777_05859 [Ooceraea biroi]|uniref:Uncharacterized protein n=1 Tax=Ooceraea biroi TaxID=2015173 RepID=A0A026WD60_OOCBI|nr:hypothetical protein X777_05859 [Ooceraea biroi]